MGKSYMTDAQYEHERDKWCLGFLILVILVGILGFLQKYTFSYVGENLTYTVRCLLFKNIVFKNIEWFDDKDRAPGILSNVLSEDIGALNGLTSEHLAVIIEAVLGLILGIALSMYYTWKLGLITLAMVPFVQIGAVFMSRL